MAKFWPGKMKKFFRNKNLGCHVISDTPSPRAIVWHYLRDPRYNGVTDRHSDRQTGRQTHEDGIPHYYSVEPQKLASACRQLLLQCLAYCGLNGGWFKCPLAAVPQLPDLSCQPDHEAVCDMRTASFSPTDSTSPSWHTRLAFISSPSYPFTRL